MQKSLAIVNGDQIEDIIIQEDTTCYDVLNQLGLEGNWLSKGDRLPFGTNQEIFSLVENGSKLYASPPANVAS